MALIVSGEDDVLALRLSVPRIGAWSADVIFDDPNPRSGQVSLVASNGETFTGTIDRGGEFEDADRTRVIAGAGGMNKPATPRQYNGATVENILDDLAADAGETISDTVDAGVLATEVDSWTTSAEPIGNVVRALMTTVGGGALWRMLPDGTLWVGRETWPDSGLDTSTYQVISKKFEDGSWVVAVDETSLLALAPGTLLEGQRVSLVVHRVDDDGEVGPRMRVWFSDADETSQEDRLAAALERVIRGAGAPPVDYRAHYRAQVIAQTGSSVHVEPEIPGTLPDMGTIPLYFGVPGLSLEGLRGGSVLVGWRGGDRSKGYAVSFDASNTVDTMTLAVLVQLFLGGQQGAQPLGMMVTFLAALNTYLAAIAACAAIGTEADPTAGPPALQTLTAATAAWVAPALQASFLSTKVSVSP